ncbi:MULTISPECIES: hypothetical protein [unclassified Caulobacter]|uniref:hypothetical protein n=1 Tax=unclassified Caulobacter TaxID=2648921 RepID=UPI000D35306B|nr:MULTISPECIES: hypothetical protein [unclassified Caulobacter]PTS89834.1 hypothetical protein DBR21_05310 [Caulobacter sp. HMWF009]PTT06013.1 hypothetical protein DBR10_13720 [Caulobacter sp. HMWF025]PTT71490.1 hypothetical protein DBR41_30385 [Pseudomonas sp. HMWF010]
MAGSVSDETALEEVLAFLDHPPMHGTPEDAVFGERLRQVMAASIADEPDGDDRGEPTLSLGEDLHRKLDAAAKRRAGTHPFGDYPDGIGPTLGMDLSHS